MNIEWRQFNNIGFLSAKLTDEQMFPIKQEIEKIKSDFSVAEKSNYSLIGHIKKEYSLIDCRAHLDQTLSPIVTAYNDTFNYFSNFNMLMRDAPIVLESSWVNFQESGEYNPMHNHSGVLSFALWVNVPYNIKDEMDLFPDMAVEKNKAACFDFCYTDSLGNIRTHTIPVDRSYENTVVMFPSSMMHSVNPFQTSNEYRISVSGNFKFLN